MKSDQCSIDWLRVSIPHTNLKEVADNVLGIPFSEFAGSDLKGSPFPSYDSCLRFANINLHSSITHSNVLIDLSGQGCRQLELYFDTVQNWHWYKLISFILEIRGMFTRIDLALDLFEESSPSVKVLQDFIKRGQLSSKSYKFVEINSGTISTGKIKGRTIYIGTHPMILRIYDKKQERIDNVGEVVDVEKWVRWELELTGKKAKEVVINISRGKPLHSIIKGILAYHYSFKTKPKNDSDLHNKNRLSNMRWWDKLVENIEKIPLKTQREKITLKKKKDWIENNTAKSIGMIYETFQRVYGKEYAEIYLQELIENGRKKFNDLDKTLVEQRVVELQSEDEY